MQTIANTAQKVMGDEPSDVINTYKVRPGGEGQSKSLTWQGANSVAVKVTDIPTVTQPKDVILRVTGTTICGSDIHLYRGEIVALQKDDILGHEFMGVVDEIGSEVDNLKKGDRVVVSFQIACGTCSYCQQKLSSFCSRTNSSSLMQTMYGQRDAGFFGYSHFTGGFPGGQAEWVKVPYGNVNCLKIPDEVPDEEALWLSDVLPTSYHSVVDTGVTDGDIVGIWGMGPIGQCAIRWALMKGAKKVIAIDKVPARLEMARQAGPEVETIDFSQFGDVSVEILKRYPQGLDRCIDATTFHEPKTLLHKVQKTLMLETDVPETANEMIRSVRKMGSCGVIAAYSAFANGFNIGALMEKGVRFIGNGQAPVHKYWEEILQMIVDKKWSSKFMVSHRVPLEEFEPLYAAFAAREGGVEKVFVETKFSNPPSAGFPTKSSVHDWSSK